MGVLGKNGKKTKRGEKLYESRKPCQRIPRRNKKILQFIFKIMDENEQENIRYSYEWQRTEQERNELWNSIFSGQ